MKYPLITFTIILLLALPAHANDKQIVDNVKQQAATVSEEIKQRVIDGFCQNTNAVPHPHDGEIVIYYQRNQDGECVAKFKTASEQQ